MKKHFERMIFPCSSFIGKQKTFPAAMLPVCLAGYSCKNIINLFLRFFFILVLVLTKFCPCFCQQIIFNKVSPPEDNSWGNVFGITQDKHGYMWFACSYGLYRYDGYNITAYKHNPLNANSPSSDHTECICIDHNGVIWTGHRTTGLDRFDPKTGIFTHFQNNPSDSTSLSDNQVNALLEDSKGILWVGTHNTGLNRLDEQTGKFIHYEYKQNDSSSLSNNTVRAIYEDKQGALWIGTGEPWDGKQSPSVGGLNKLDKATGKFIRYLNDPKDPHSLIDNRVRAIFEDSKGNFWIGTVGDGLHIMNREKGTFERYTYDPAHPEKLSRPPIVGNVDHITFITEDATGSIWIGTLNAGINRYDPKTKRITHYEKAGSNQVGYSDISSWCAFTSGEGILWISTFEKSVYRIDPFQKNLPYSFTGESPGSVIEAPSNVYWMGSLGRGLLLKDSAHNIEKSYQYDPADPKSISGNYINIIRKDHQGNNLWIGTDRGLDLFDIDKQTFARYIHDSKNDKTLMDNDVTYIYQDHEEKLWIGTNGGLDQFDRKTGTFIHYQVNPADTSKSFSQVSTIFEDQQHNLWVGTWFSGGLYRLDNQTGKFKHYLNSGITGICNDKDGNLWVGATDNLYLYNKSTDDFSPYIAPSSGTGITHILDLLQDDKKNIWICTSSSIIKFDKSKTRVFGKNYGVHRNTLDITDGYETEKGNIIFPDQTGFYSFNPKELSSSFNSKPPQIHLTDFRLAVQSNTDTNSVLKLPVDEAKEIKLNHKQNAFSFSFVAIHYSSPENNLHLFMLENYDNNWRQATSERTAYYYNVPPGHYIFHVKAASSDGVWAEKTIAIIISPPWWRTWWAYCIYGLLLIAVIYGIDRFQRNRVILAERKRTREKELAQAKEIEKAYHELRTTQAQLIQSEKMASLGELTAGIAHEIQNPLNFVNNFSDVNKEMLGELNEEIDKGNYDDAKSIAKDVIANEEKINYHGKRADAIVKGMLQHSRASSGQKEFTDINKLADEYLRLSYHGMRAKDKSFNAEFKTEFDESIDKINVVPQDIGRVMLNLFNNAFYAVNEKKKIADDAYQPTVSVQTKKLNDKAEIKVTDNGNGIPQNIVDKIFQPFFTTKPTGQGTGLGLSLAYDIIKAHGGEIKVVTKEGEGSEFIVHLPV